MTRSNVIKALSLALLLAAGACDQKNEAIPKLVSVENFEAQAKEEFVGSAVSFSIPKIDILFIIDESGSMRPYQESLAENIDIFLDGIRRVDRLSYRIAVTTSGPADSPHYRHPNGMVSVSGPPLGIFHKKDSSEPSYITNTTPAGLDLLRDRLMPGITGNAYEKFFEPLLTALTRPEQQDFVREDALLAIFFLTDAEEATYWIDVPTLYETLVDLKGGDESKVVAYGAVIPTANTSLPPGCTRDDQGPPKRLEAFIAMTGGKIFDICSNTYGAELAKVGQELGAKVVSSTNLNEVPDPTTIRVYIGNREVPNDPRMGWVYMPESNEIVFGPGFDVDKTDQIRVTYTAANQFRK